MKVITIVNHKGGVAKTTSTHNIGAALALNEKKVLLIDLDAQMNLTKCLGIEVEKLEKGAGDFILGGKFSDIVQKTTLLDIIPANLTMNSREFEIKSNAEFPHNLVDVLNELKNQYDYVLIDCPPSLSTYSTLALVASDYYLVPLQAEFLSWEGIRSVLDFAKKASRNNQKLKLAGVFATRFNPNKRNEMTSVVVENAQEQLGEYFLKTYIRDNNTISKAQANGKSALEYSPESNGAQDYYNLTQEIVTRIK